MIKEYSLLDKEIPVQDCNSNRYDKIANQLLSGKITSDSARKMTVGMRYSVGKDKTKKVEATITRTLKYDPTDSSLEYIISGDTIHISGASSGQECQGGVSYLLSKIDEIARKKGIKTLELEVWELNRKAYNFCKNRGFVETSREYRESADGTIITMQKNIFN